MVHAAEVPTWARVIRSSVTAGALVAGLVCLLFGHASASAPQWFSATTAGLSGILVLMATSWGFGAAHWDLPASLASQAPWSTLEAPLREVGPDVSG